MKFVAARLHEEGFTFHGNLFQRFKTVRNKAWADHVHTSGILLAELCQYFRGVRSQPFGFAETGLEADLVLVRT
jgi:hypothetical protein